MTVSRASANLGRTVLRRASAQTRSRAWRQIGRRQYATEHSSKSSDLPWMIGSVVFTVPAAVWLIGQAPKTSDHHEGAAHEVKEEDSEEKEEGTEEKSEEGGEEDSSKDEKDDGDKKEDDSDSDKSKDESSDEDSDKDSDKESGKKAGKSEDGSGKGPGEGQKGPRRPAEKKGEKDSNSDKSGAKNPNLDDDEKSKKGEGLKDTAKIHGTVSSDRPLR